MIKAAFHFCKRDVMTPFIIDSYRLAVAGGLQEYVRQSQKRLFSSQNGETREFLADFHFGDLCHTLSMTIVVTFPPSRRQF